MQQKNMIMTVLIIILTIIFIIYTQSVKIKPSNIVEKKPENIGDNNWENNILGLGYMDSEYKNFHKYFQLIDTIRLDLKNLSIGDISKLIVFNDHNKIFVYDRITDKIIWIDLIGKKFKILSVEKILPGYKILLACFRKIHNKLWISSAPDYYFIFNQSGELNDYFKIENTNLSFKLSSLSNSNIVGYFTSLNDYPFIGLYERSKEKLKKMFNIHFFNGSNGLIHRTSDYGGFLVDKSDYIYVASPFENIIYKYNLEGKQVSKIESENKYFKMTDLTRSKNKNEAINIFLTKKFSMFLDMFFLNNDIIIALYKIDKKPNIELFNFKNGKVLNDERIISPLHMGYASDNIVYLIYYPERLKTDGNLPNPLILKYKFKEFLN